MVNMAREFFKYISNKYGSSEGDILQDIIFNDHHPKEDVISFDGENLKVNSENTILEKLTEIVLKEYSMRLYLKNHTLGQYIRLPKIEKNKLYTQAIKFAFYDSQNVKNLIQESDLKIYKNILLNTYPTEHIKLNIDFNDLTEPLREMQVANTPSDIFLENNITDFTDILLEFSYETLITGYCNYILRIKLFDDYFERIASPKRGELITTIGLIYIINSSNKSEKGAIIPIGINKNVNGLMYPGIGSIVRKEEDYFSTFNVLILQDRIDHRISGFYYGLRYILNNKKYKQNILDVKKKSDNSKKIRTGSTNRVLLLKSYTLTSNNVFK